MNDSNIKEFDIIIDFQEYANCIEVAELDLIESQLADLIRQVMAQMNKD